MSFCSHTASFWNFLGHRQKEKYFDVQVKRGIVLEIAVVQARYRHLFAAVCLDVICNQVDWVALKLEKLNLVSAGRALLPLHRHLQCVPAI